MITYPNECGTYQGDNDKAISLHLFKLSLENVKCSVDCVSMIVKNPLALCMQCLYPILVVKYVHIIANRCVRPLATHITAALILS